MTQQNRNNHHNVRQLGSKDMADKSQSQILSALDVLGAKLVRSEAERETMRRLLNESIEAQDRLETLIERSQIHIERRIDQLEQTPSESLSAEDKSILETYQQTLDETRQWQDDFTQAHHSIDDRLKDSQQLVAKLQRKIDQQEQKRARLQRRIERVENIATEAQNALEAKALVLLTDQSEAVRQALPHIDTTQALQAINQNGVHEGTAQTPSFLTAANDTDTLSPSLGQKMGWFWKNGGSMVAIIAAVGLGWMMATTMQNGTQRQAIVQTPTMNNDSSQSVPSLSDEITAFETDWMVQDFLDNAMNDMAGDDATVSAPQPYDVIQTVTTNDITIDKDLTLPDVMKELEAKAFANIPEAQHDLAALYVAGQAGVTQNYERAAFWFSLAANQNIANAAYNLGVLYQQGVGQSQDISKALDWYRRASRQGHPEALYNLGIAYIEGVGTRYNPNMAAFFFEKSALGGISEAAYNLGLILENGLLGTPMTKEALIWYRGAADNGNIAAEDTLKNLSNSLNIPMNEAGIVNSDGQTITAYMTGVDTDISALPSLQKFHDVLPTPDQIMVSQIQEQLRKAGIYTGPQDGIIGEGTIKAIQTYQDSHNLPVNGEATNTLLDHMLWVATR